MPRARHPDKMLVTLWMHRAMLEVLDRAAEAEGVNRTRFILNTLAERLGLTLDEAGMPVDPDLERLAVQVFENRKPAVKKRSSRRPAAGAPSGGPADEASKTGKPSRKT